ncbi:MAG: TonB-dependent siderophore receptor [Gemmatimonadales bacterium]
MHKSFVDVLALSVAATIVLAGSPLLSAAQEPARPDSAASKTHSSDSASGRSAKAQTLEAVRVKAKSDRSYAPGVTRTATKMSAVPRDIPQSLLLINHQLVRDQAMQTMADVVRYVPGITMGQGEGNRDQPTIRGNSSTADFFVDGVRDDAQYLRDLYNLERVEALKGSNAMVFGRGGGGGVLNRVTKEAESVTRREVTLEGGSFGKRRATLDLQHSLSDMLAGRLNSVYERSDSYRDGVYINRYGVNPTFTAASRSKQTRLSAGYEYFRDYRTADRGIPSYLGKPIETDASTFFGNVDDSYSSAIVNTANATITHDAGGLQLRNHSQFANYDKHYQNIYPGAVDASGQQVSLVAYRNSVDRRNAFNQTDLNWHARTGVVSHDLMIGAEVGRQRTESFRETGFFNVNQASTMVPVSSPTTSIPVSFRQSATDADHGTVASTRSIYAQDQLSISEGFRLIGGARYERFDVRYRDDRSTARFNRDDGMLSPRVGIVAKPVELLSFYASYSLSFLPGSGDQFASLTEISDGLKPERFSSYEAGAKWDAMDRLALTAAVYRLDRTNTRAPNPLDPTRLVQTGAQRSEGFEAAANGSVTDTWQVATGFARQNAEIVNATSASPAGARVALVPHTTSSLWNKVAITPKLSVALGAVHQSSVFAAIDNKVTLPAFTRFDGAIFGDLGHGLRAQVNVENLLNRKYYPTATSNNNITPGSPRAARISISAGF